MATQPHSAPQGASASPFGMPVPPPAVSRLLARYSRDELAGFVAVAIDLLDLTDGDPDLEDATNAEDDFALTPAALRYCEAGPGCAFADGSGEDDDPSGQCDEDGINTQQSLAWSSHPGCIISDSDCANEGY